MSINITPRLACQCAPRDTTPLLRGPERVRHSRLGWELTRAFPLGNGDGRGRSVAHLDPFRPPWIRNARQGSLLALEGHVRHNLPVPESRRQERPGGAQIAETSPAQAASVGKQPDHVGIAQNPLFGAAWGTEATGRSLG